MGLLSRLCLILMVFAGIGCASTDEARFIPKPAEPDNYRAHPGAYLTDRFPVERKIQRSPANDIPFYFKECTRNVGTFMGTNTRYDCD